MFRLRGHWIQNDHGKVLEVHSGIDTENRMVRMYSKNNGAAQKWWIKYVDALAPEPKKGDLNKQYGLYVDRPFHIVASWGKRRYLDVVSRDMVIKTPNGRKSQVWWFDQRTKTIKNKWGPVRSYSFNVLTSNRNDKNSLNNINLSGTNSNW